MLDAVEPASRTHGEFVQDLNGLIQLATGCIICLLPVGIIAGFIALSLRSSRGRSDARLKAVEVELWKLGQENRALAQRVSYLEVTLRAVQQGDAAPVSAMPEAPAQQSPARGDARATPADARTDGATRAEPASELAAVAPSSEAAHAPGMQPAAAASPGGPSGVVGGPAEAPGVANAGDGPPSGGSGPAPTPPAPPGPAPERIGWERWIGVRGAAALGASILVLAGIYFFEYSIEHGLITPAMRVAAGTLVGLGCVLASEVRLRRTHPVLASWIGGAGIAILYVAFWAGCALYQLYPTWAAGILMVSVTGTCIALALQRRSAVIAVFGLLGGFVTPLALSTGSDQPIPLFGYLLLLDGAMLWLAQRRRWAWMALLCLGLTAFYQYTWLFSRLDEPRVFLGVIIVLVFAILFAAIPRDRGEKDENAIWKFARSAGVLVPLLFTVSLAMREDLGATFWPTALLLIALCVAASIVGMRHRSAFLPSSAALLSVGTLLGWALAHDFDSPGALAHFVGLALGVILVFHAAAEVDRARFESTIGPTPAWLTLLAISTITALSAPFTLGGGLWPWLALWAGVSASGLRLASFSGRAQLQLGPRRSRRSDSGRSSRPESAAA